MASIGLIAGNRTFPIHVARAAKALGYGVVAVGLREETSPDLEREVDQMHWMSLAEVGQVPELLKREGIRQVILAGQISAARLLQNDAKLEGLLQGFLKFLPDRSGTSAMKLAVKVLEAQGFEVLDSCFFLKEWIPVAGVLTRRAPTPEERDDALFGLPLARELSRLQIGQTLVVRKRAVVAVEAVEGTDAAIRRAGQVVGPGCVVVKACGPDHDMRFDIPVVGEETLRAMVEAAAPCLAVEAKRTLLFDRPRLIEEADRLGLSILAL